MLWTSSFLRTCCSALVESLGDFPSKEFRLSSPQNRVVILHQIGLLKFRLNPQPISVVRGHRSDFQLADLDPAKPSYKLEAQWGRRHRLDEW